MQDQQLLEQIKTFSQDIGYISISSVQRKFMLSYTHAEQLVDTLIPQGFIQIQHVGDSRVYLFSGHQHKWYALTKDHNFLNEMAENGEIQIIVGQEYASFYYMLNYCFCADSQHEIPEFSPQEEYLTDEDALLICSDGVHDILECDTWQPLLAETSLKTWLMEMKNALYQHHAYDNVSMILIRLVQQGE